MKRLFTFPRMGKYTDIFAQLIPDLGLEIILPPEISSNTVQLGVKHSPEMMCYPFKITLGQSIEAIEAGATDIVMYNNCGTCRYRQYYIIQDLILKNIGYNVTMHQLRPTTLINDIRSLNPKNSYAKIWKAIRKAWKGVIDLEEMATSKIDNEKVNIAVIGEIYVNLEPFMNMNLFRKIQMYGARAHTKVKVEHLVTDRHSMVRKQLIRKGDDDYMKKARKFLDGDLGGHGVQNIRDTLYYTDHNIDGVIHVLPLSCMPEVTIEPVINKICQDTKTPLLRLNVDETNSEVNVDTRLETFVELLKRKKARKVTA